MYLCRRVFRTRPDVRRAPVGSCSIARRPRQYSTDPQNPDQPQRGAGRGSLNLSNLNIRDYQKREPIMKSRFRYPTAGDLPPGRTPPPPKEPTPEEAETPSPEPQVKAAEEQEAEIELPSIGLSEQLNHVERFFSKLVDTKVNKEEEMDRLEDVLDKREDLWMEKPSTLGVGGVTEAQLKPPFETLFELSTGGKGMKPATSIYSIRQVLPDYEADNIPPPDGIQENDDPLPLEMLGFGEPKSEPKKEEEKTSEEGESAALETKEEEEEEEEGGVDAEWNPETSPYLKPTWEMEPTSDEYFFIQDVFNDALEDLVKDIEEFEATGQVREDEDKEENEQADMEDIRKELQNADPKTAAAMMKLVSSLNKQRVDREPLIEPPPEDEKLYPTYLYDQLRMLQEEAKQEELELQDDELKREVEKRRRDREAKNALKPYSLDVNIKDLDTLPTDPLLDELVDPQTRTLPPPEQIPFPQDVEEIFGAPPAALMTDPIKLDYSESELERMTAEEVIEHAKLNMDLDRVTEQFIDAIYVNENDVIADMLNSDQLQRQIDEFQAAYGKLPPEMESQLRHLAHNVAMNFNPPAETDDELEDFIEDVWAQRMITSAMIQRQTLHLRRSIDIKEAKKEQRHAKLMERRKDIVKQVLAKRAERRKQLKELRKQLLAERQNDPNWFYHQELKMWLSKEQLQKSSIKAAVQTITQNPSWSRAEKRKFVQSVIDFTNQLENIPEEDKEHIRWLYNQPPTEEKPLIEIEHHLKLPITDWNQLIADATAGLDEKEKAEKHPKFKPPPKKKRVVMLQNLIEKMKAKSAAVKEAAEK